MEELIIDKKFDSKKELDDYCEKISKEYIVFMVNLAEQVIGEPEIYGIHSIFHFGKRR